MDMKARGMYICRTLSYDGAVVKIVPAKLKTSDMDTYKKATEVWASLREDFCSAIDCLPEKPNTSKIWTSYWSTHQRFFKYLCTSFKVKTAVKRAESASNKNKCVVIGLQSTGEAMVNEASKHGPKWEDFLSGPSELLQKFVEDYYPLPKKPELLSDANGSKSDYELEEEEENAASDVGSSNDEFQKCEIGSTEKEREELSLCSLCGKSVEEACICQQDKTVEHPPPETNTNELQKSYDTAMERKKEMLERIRALKLPKNPLDEIIGKLGGPDKVAEITGRDMRLVKTSSGDVVYQSRKAGGKDIEMVNMNEKNLFMRGTKLVAIISAVASTGISLQADKRQENQKRRVHLTLELPWSADGAIQQLGRTHRSNQASVPKYRLLVTNLGGERRFVSAVAERLESLGALTQGDRRAGLSLSAYNYHSPYGKQALNDLYKGILHLDRLPVVPPGCLSGSRDTMHSFIKQATTALASVGISKDNILGYERDIGRFLNRILGIAPVMQNRLFGLFVDILNHHVRNARNEGKLDTGIVDIKGKFIKLKRKKKIYLDQKSTASTFLFTFTLKNRVSWKLANTMLNEKKQKPGSSDAAAKSYDGFYKSKESFGKECHVILALESSASDRYKIVRPTTGESPRDICLEGLRSEELTDNYSKVKSLEWAQAHWEKEYEATSSKREEVYILGGVILPLWTEIQTALSEVICHQLKIFMRKTRFCRC